MDDSVTPGPIATPQPTLSSASGDSDRRKLNLKLILGSITDVPCQAYVLGVFDNVNPTGTAKAVDVELGGKLSILVQDRMFGSRLGEIFILPTPRQRALCEMVVIVGLGPIDNFKPRILALVAENLARVATTARLHALAVVPMGTNAGLTVDESTRSFSAGFLRGLERGDPDRDFKEIQLCEIMPDRFETLKSGLRKFVDDGYFRTEHNCDVSLSTHTIAASNRSAPRTAGQADGTADPVYLQVGFEADPVSGQERFVYTVLTADLGAAIDRYEHQITPEMKQAAGLKLQQAKKVDAELGHALAEYYMPAATRDLMKKHLDSNANRHVVIIHDSASSHVPWEVLHFGEHCPAYEVGMTRKLVKPATRAGGRSHLPRGSIIKMLLIANPTKDLPGAEREGQMLLDLFNANNGHVEILRRDEATKANIMRELDKSDYDILHYAGHADFVEGHPEESGVKCADGYLTSADFTHTVSAPQLVFLNGCESARVRDRGQAEPINVTQNLYGGLKKNVSLAELILTNGVGNFIGTYWPVNDAAALRFSEVLYQHLLRGRLLGAALREARHATREIHERDWANYIHFGNPVYCLREG